MAPTLVRQFEALWESSDAPPDVFAFLVQHDGSDADARLAVLLADQNHRWKTDAPLRVEDYLQRVPELASDPEIKLQLAVGEFRARQNGDASPGIDEFTTRFADIGDTLRSKLTELVSGDDEEEHGRFTTTHVYITESTNGDQQIGRYRLERVLGEGAFGRVYLGFDEELQRQVAIKVPTEERFQKPEDVEQYLQEARTVASLNHPNIVPVYDTGRTDDGSIYVVSRFIEGCTLRERIKKDRPGHDESAKLMMTAALALHHAHERRLIHRDVKPSNILLEDSTGTPYVADFGLAIREEDYLSERKIKGTPAYMSPEQAGGEGHRLDGRSDIFSVGIILYQLLTGHKPFRGSTHNELFHQIISVDPRPPREQDDSIPAELQRICLKTLSKRASDRYATAAELADDLLHWTDQPEQGVQQLQIVPRGLRPFEAEDADFFLDLLPGPRNRNGLPQSVQFWKTRIEETDPDKTFNVGLIYGPSGCGKSSLIRAGLLPRLSNEVIAVYVEATPDETETRILRGLRKQLPDFPQDLGLIETLTLLRREPGRTVVLILDQFEQWLHAQLGTEQNMAELVHRICVNAMAEQVQCDASWCETTSGWRSARFMRELESPNWWKDITVATR